MLKTEKTISLDIPWAIGENRYSKIRKMLSTMKIEQILEFGSGASTIRLCQDFPEASIVSIEHHKQFYNQTIDLLRQYQVDNALVLHFPLKRIKFGLRSYLTYGLHAEKLASALKNDIDFVLIDGPVESETLRGREAPLYFIFPFLKVGGVIALDDYHRNSAKRVVKNWQNAYRENLLVVREYERLILLQKCGTYDSFLYPGVLSTLDNWYVNARLAFRHLKSLIRPVIKVLG